MKPGKTESLIFGTRKNLSKNEPTLNLTFNGKPINATTNYKYLGTVLDQTLSMNQHFASLYKKMSAKLRLLSMLKPNLTQNAVNKIYTGMLLPTLLYCSTTGLNLTNSQQNKLQSIDKRVRKITGKCQTPIINEIKKHAVILVRKCMSDTVCCNFENFFQVKSHSKNTRNNNYQLTVPKVKLEVMRSGFKFMGVKIYNDLPMEIRKENSLQDFIRKTKNYFNL